MSAPLVLEEPLEEVADLLPVALSTVYTMRWRGTWTWLIKRGRFLFIELLAAADFWKQQGRRHVVARLRRRASALRVAKGEQGALFESSLPAPTVHAPEVQS